MVKQYQLRFVKGRLFVASPIQNTSRLNNLQASQKLLNNFLLSTINHQLKLTVLTGFGLPLVAPLLNSSRFVQRPLGDFAGAIDILCAIQTF